MISTCDDRYAKNKKRTYVNKGYTNFHGLNVPEDDIQCECFTFISIDSLTVHESKYYLQVYSDNWVIKLETKKITDYLKDNLLETDQD